MALGNRRLEADRYSCASLGVHNAPQDLALPVGLVDGPAVDGPVALANHLRSAVKMDITLTFLFRRLEMAVDGPGVAAAPINRLVVNDGDDARLGQIEKAPGDDFMA